MSIYLQEPDLRTFVMQYIGMYVFKVSYLCMESRISSRENEIFVRSFSNLNSFGVTMLYVELLALRNLSDKSYQNCRVFFYLRHSKMFS